MKKKNQNTTRSYKKKKKLKYKAVFDKSFILRSEVLIGIFLEMYIQSLSLLLSRARACCHSNVAMTGITLTDAVAARSSPAAPAAPDNPANPRGDMPEEKVPRISCR